MKRIKLIAGLSAVLVLSILAFLIIKAPASVAFSFVRDDLAKNAPEILVTAVGGTVWSGVADVKFANFPPSTLSWDELDLSPFDREVEARLKLAAPSHDLSSRLRANASRVRLAETSGFIDHTYVDPWGASYGLAFEGTIDVRRLELESDQRWLTDLDADLSWSGGNVTYTAYGETQIYTLPVLDVAARLDGTMLRADVTHDAQTVMEVSLSQDGVSYVAVKARLFLLANLPWPGGQPADESVIEVERPLW